MVTESWLNSDIPDSLISVPGYTIFRSDRQGRSGGGVCIYLLDRIHSNATISPIVIDSPGAENVCLHLKNKILDLVICCVYRPGDVSTEDTGVLLDSLSQLALTHRDLIITGDFNFPDITWMPSPTAHTMPSTAFLEFINGSHLHQLVDAPTRFRTGQQPSTLDLVLTSDTDLITLFDNLPPIGKSDHVVLKFSIQVLYESVPRKITKDQHIINYIDLNRKFANIRWSQCLVLPTVEENWQLFITTLQSAVTECRHSKQVTVYPKKPWITADVQKSIRKKKTLWQKFLRSRTEADYLEHRRFSNRLSVEILNAKSSYEKDLIVSDNPKRFFKYVRSHTNSKVGRPQIRLPDESISSNDTQVAETFAETFFSSFTREPDGEIPSVQLCSRRDEQLCSVEFTEEIVLQKLIALNVTKSPGIDNISTMLLKRCAHELCVPLLILIKQSFSTAALPIQWKTSVVKPIYKKGDKFDANNYRPISLIPVIGKVMESIITDALTDFLAANKIIPLEQHGFTRGKSLVTNLLCCLSDWTKFVDGGESVDIVYLDFSKAFDRVPKKRLLSKLDHFGVRGALLDWISAFLSDRHYMVEVGGSRSEEREVLSGVPQGSVLGPILFNIFTADLRYVVSSGFSLYADDTKVYSLSSKHEEIQSDLNRIYEWSERWLLPLNIPKCVVLYVGKNNPRCSYSINGSTLLQTDSHVDLGVVINSNLTWSEQTLRQVKKANSSAFILSKVFSNCSNKICSKLFKTYVRPILEFANPVWSPNLVKDINLLESVQRRFTRLPFKFHQRPSYEDRLRLLNLISLADRRTRGDVITTYKALKTDDSPIYHLFDLNLDARLRGHHLKLIRENFKTTQRQNFLPNRVFHQWNSLTDEIVSAPSVSSFKVMYDRFRA